MAAPIRMLCHSVWSCSRRHFGITSVVQAGKKWRKEHGLAVSASEYGPMTDLPDWSFADGRPAPPLKGQLRRRQEREALSRRIVMLSAEMDHGIESWKQRQEDAANMEEHKRSQLLKPKGHLVAKKMR